MQVKPLKKEGMQWTRHIKGRMNKDNPRICLYATFFSPSPVCVMG